LAAADFQPTKRLRPGGIQPHSDFPDPQRWLVSEPVLFCLSARGPHLAEFEEEESRLKRRLFRSRTAELQWLVGHLPTAWSLLGRRCEVSSKELEYTLAPGIRGFRVLRYFVHVFTNGIFELADIDRMREEPMVHCVLWVNDDLKARV
jgi:hypothetical protein